MAGYFEAWQFGPVHPTVYQAFKAAGDRHILYRAVQVDLYTGERTVVEIPESQDVKDIASRVILSYGSMTAGRLVEISHAINGPWHYVANKAASSTSLGLRITDEMILERFKYHKITVTTDPRHGEPNEDAPLA